MNLEINQIRVELNNFKIQNGLEEGQLFISSDYKHQKQKIKELINHSKKIHMEHERLNSNLIQMEQMLMESRDAVNKFSQYSRLSYMADLSGIQFKKVENCLKIINKVGRMTNIEDYELGQVNLAHRTS